MKIGGLQKLSMVDYPGKMSCTILFTGCNFRCSYCHNSLLVLPEPDHEWIPEEQLFSYLKKRQGILEGVCISGGEPLLQGRNIIPFLETIKELGYPVKLDTNGTFPELLRELCERELVDYVAMDIKNSRENYGRAIGVEQSKLNEQPGNANQNVLDKQPGKPEQNLLDRIQQSVDFLLQNQVDYEFRTTLVKGIHEPQDIEKICHWIGGAKAWYLQNFKDSGSLLAPNSCQMSSFSENEMELMEKTAKNYKMNVFVRNV